MNFRRPFLILFLLVAVSAVHLAIYTWNINLKYEVEIRKRSLNKLQDEVRHLNSLSSQRSDLRRIENIAVNKLRMIRPKEMNYIMRATPEITP